MTEAELVEFCRSRLAHYKCPQSVDFLDSLPKTGTGKILKRELRKLYGSGAAERVRVRACRMKSSIPVAEPLERRPDPIDAALARREA